MRYKPDMHHRRSIRLSGYDYATAGAYFVTVCTFGREMLFEDDRLRTVTKKAWYRLPRRFPHMRLDEFVVMANHVHGILWITADGVGARLRTVVGRRMSSGLTTISPELASTLDASPLRAAYAFRAPLSGSLGAIVGSFKSDAARRINRLRGTPGAALWQRNYYERIIRDEAELNAVRQYIRDNPSKWADDPNNPANFREQPPWGEAANVSVGPDDIARNATTSVCERDSEASPLRANH
jgi:REP element-mobilizing transposase RayT